MLNLEVTKEKRLNEALATIAGYGADVRSMATEQADDMLIVHIELMISPDCDSAALIKDLSNSKGIKEVSISGYNVEDENEDTNRQSSVEEGQPDGKTKSSATASSSGQPGDVSGGLKK